MGATAVLLSSAVAAEPEPSGFPGTADGHRVAVQLQLLAVGEGTRVLDSRRVVVDVGMEASIELAGRRNDAGVPVPVRCRLQLRTAPAEEGRVSLQLAADVRQRRTRGEAPDWQSRSRAELFPGTSSVVEVAPAREPGERLVVSLTLDEAEGEVLTVPAPPIEIDLEIKVRDGDRERVLQQPRLRTFAGEPVEFAFDYPVPAADGGGFDHVRMQVNVWPGFPTAGRLPLQIDVTGGFPGPSGPVVASRSHTAALRLGESWTVEVRGEAAADGPALELRVTPWWRARRFDGGGSRPL